MRVASRGLFGIHSNITDVDFYTIRLLALNYSRKRVVSYIFSWVLNTPVASMANKTIYQLFRLKQKAKKIRRTAVEHRVLKSSFI